MKRSPLVLIASVWLLTSPLFAQDSAEQANPRQAEGPPAKIRVETVEFKSDVPLPASAEANLTRYITRRAIYDEPDWLEDLESRVKDAWQHYGYFFPDIQTTVRAMGQNAVEHNFALTFHVTAGQRYKLDKIRISGAKLFANDMLLECFDLHEGDVFDVYRIRNGLDCLRSGYDANGFLNFVTVPETRIDDAHGRINLLVEVEEGEQFRIGKITVQGAKKNLIQSLMQDSGLKSGTIYSSRLVEDFIQKNRFAIPDDMRVDDDIERKIDESSHTVDLIFHLPGEEP